MSALGAVWQGRIKAPALLSTVPPIVDKSKMSRTGRDVKCNCVENAVSLCRPWLWIWTASVKRLLSLLSVVTLHACSIQIWLYWVKLLLLLAAAIVLQLQLLLLLLFKGLKPLYSAVNGGRLMWRFLFPVTVVSMSVSLYTWCVVKWCLRKTYCS